ncbi:hypothetical protein [Sphingomonas rubra]|uniref:Uncharacterized protein n=1 Tax=Sphingomonas rubra TaxID=634430 RepID=A0A1I5PZJ8_9SPHN|nr:hypothetical protein [Sphingomonas rubra]SFP39435.1 hypothetical protein SAMN04488241_101352 [Sphingomonas rubra]
MPDDQQHDQQPGADDQESAKPKPVEKEQSGAGYGNNAGPQDEVDEQ